MKKLPANYPGRILTGNYSSSLVERTLSVIRTSEAIDTGSFPLMHYISAWDAREQTIWYEFVGQQFVDLLQTSNSDIGNDFRKGILDQRLYHYTEVNQEVEEEIISRNQLSDKRFDLRESVSKKKAVDAVYQVLLPSEKIIWLKDQGRVEHFPEDNISLTLGILTDVTKEMEQKELLERIGYFDDLTGLPQRKIMARLLEVKTGERQRGYLGEFSVLMIDIDRFKVVNDTHGHQAGDFVLKEIASLMIAIKRKEEDIGRYGGEEFYGICLGKLQSGTEYAERIRRSVQDHTFTYNRTDIPITISVGVASSEEMVQVDTDELLALADKRLYQAKHQGRNRVVGSQ